MIFIITTAIASVVAGFFGLNYFMMKKYNLDMILSAIKKRKPLLLMESSSGVYPYVPENQIENIAFLQKTGDTVVVPDGTLKNCPTFGNISIGHGDLYLSALVPMDLNRYINDRIKEGKSMDDIAKEIDKISNKESEIPEKYKSQSKKNKKQNVFNTVTFGNIRNFLNTGLNRTYLKRMYQTLIEQRRLEHLLGISRDWMKIVIPAAILIIIITVALVMLQNSGFFADLGGAVGPAAQVGNRIAP